LFMAAQLALVADDAFALLDHVGGEHAVAVDLRATGLDLFRLLLPGLVGAALGHRSLHLAGENPLWCKPAGCPIAGPERRRRPRGLGPREAKEYNFSPD